jgi:hypothetical protein
MPKRKAGKSARPFVRPQGDDTPSPAAKKLAKALAQHMLPKIVAPPQPPIGSAPSDAPAETLQQ